MKVKYSFLIFLFVLLFNLLSCHKNNSPLENDNEKLPPSGVNLILNPSFEFNGEQSLKYWHVEDWPEIYFSNDTPPGGGNWSIFLHAQWAGPLPTSPSYYVPLSPGRHIVKFSFYGKSKTIPGAAYLILKTGKTREEITLNMVTDSIWTEYTSIDTLDIQEGDSLFVLLHGGNTEVADGITYFDLVDLELMVSD